MSTHLFSLPRSVQALIQQAVTAAERPTQLQFEQLAHQINQNAEFQNLIKSGQAQPVTGQQVDSMIRRVQKNAFGSDAGENRDQREARLAQRNDAAGYLDRFVTQLSENFDMGRQATEDLAVGVANLDAVLTECQGNVLNLRYTDYPEGIQRNLEAVHARFTELLHTAIAA